MWRWIRRHYHEALVAYWESSIETARHVRDWEYHNHARERLRRHQDAIDRLQAQID